MDVQGMIAWCKRWWPALMTVAVVCAVFLVQTVVRDENLERVPVYASPMGGLDYCSKFGESLIRYSRNSRTCAWFAFFPAVILSGIAVVVGADENPRQEDSYWTKLCKKHRSVVLLVGAACFWVTAYAAFMRVEAASDAASSVVGHLAEAQKRRAGWVSLSLAQSTTASNVVPAPESSGSITPPESSVQAQGTALSASDDDNSARAVALDRNLYAACIITRGQWEKSRTHSTDFARALAQKNARGLLEGGDAAERAEKSAKNAREAQIDTATSIAALKAARAESGNVSAATDTALQTARRLEETTRGATNALAAVDPALAAELEPRLGEIRVRVQEATDAAASITVALATPPAGSGGPLEPNVGGQVEQMVVKTQEAVELAAQVTNVVEAAAAVEQANGAPNP